MFFFSELLSSACYTMDRAIPGCAFTAKHGELTQVTGVEQPRHTVSEMKQLHLQYQRWRDSLLPPMVAALRTKTRFRVVWGPSGLQAGAACSACAGCGWEAAAASGQQWHTCGAASVSSCHGSGGSGGTCGQRAGQQ